MTATVFRKLRNWGQLIVDAATLGLKRTKLFRMSRSSWRPENIQENAKLGAAREFPKKKT